MQEVLAIYKFWAVCIQCELLVYFVPVQFKSKHVKSILESEQCWWSKVTRQVWSLFKQKFANVSKACLFQLNYINKQNILLFHFQAVGCDLVVRSELVLDKCGVCGGNGSKCEKMRYRWEEEPLSRCSVGCGGGTRMSRPVCHDTIDKTRVDDGMCDQLEKPETRMTPCNTDPCPARSILLFRFKNNKLLEP